MKKSTLTGMNTEQLKREIKLKMSLAGDISDKLKILQGTLNQLEIDKKKENPMKIALIIKIKTKNVTQEFDMYEKDYKQLIDDADAMEKELATRK